MWYYIIIFAFSFVALAVRDKKLSRLLCNALLVFMFLMTAFRAETIGIDTQSYKDIFESGYRLAAYIREFLFSGIGLLVYNYTEDYRLFQVIMAFITYVPWFYLLNKKSTILPLSLLLFIFSTNRYFFETFNMVRQAAATPYLLLCWIMISEKKYLKSLLFFAIALGFHKSSLYYIPIVFVAWKWTFKANTIRIMQIATLSFAFLFASMSTITNLIQAVVPDVFLNSIISVDHYADYREELARSFWGLLPMLLPNAFVACFYYYKHKENLLMRIFTVGSIFLNIVAVYPMSYRITYGVIALEVLLFPLIFHDRTKYKSFLVFVIACIVIFSLFDFFSTCGMELARLVPYKSFL